MLFPRARIGTRCFCFACPQQLEPTWEQCCHINDVWPAVSCTHVALLSIDNDDNNDTPTTIHLTLCIVCFSQHSAIVLGNVCAHRW